MYAIFLLDQPVPDVLGLADYTCLQVPFKKFPHIYFPGIVYIYCTIMMPQGRTECPPLWAPADGQLSYPPSPEPFLHLVRSDRKNTFMLVIDDFFSRTIVGLCGWGAYYSNKNISHFFFLHVFDILLFSQAISSSTSKII